MSGDVRRRVRRLLDQRARQRVAASSSAYLSLERAYPQLRPAELGAIEPPAGHGRMATYKKGCKCLWCREAQRLAKQRYRERRRALA